MIRKIHYWTFIACMVLAFPASAVDKPQHVLKFATLAPSGSTWMNLLEEWDRNVRAKSQGRLGFKFYPGGVQGDEKDVLRKRRNGQLHAKLVIV